MMDYLDKKVTYKEQNDIQNTLKLREVLNTLPDFCRDYFRAIDTTTTTKTRISYAYDIRIFFSFFSIQIQRLRIIPSEILRLMFWIRSRLSISRNTWNI